MSNIPFAQDRLTNIVNVQWPSAMYAGGYNYNNTFADAIKFKKDGTVEVQFPSPNPALILGVPRSLAADSTGVYIGHDTDAVGSALEKFSKTGELLWGHDFGVSLAEVTIIASSANSSDSDGPSRYVYAYCESPFTSNVFHQIDGDTGATIRPLGFPLPPSMLSPGPSGGVLVATSDPHGSNNGSLFCLDKDGNILWSKAGVYTLPKGSGKNCAALNIFTSQLILFDKATGTVKWTASAPGTGIDMEGDIFVVNDNIVSRYAAENGQLKYSTTVTAHFSPIIAASGVFAVTHGEIVSDTSTLVGIRLYNQDDGSLLTFVPWGIDHSNILEGTHASVNLLAKS